VKIVVAISGASGVHLGIKFIQYLPDEIEIFCVISNSAKKTLLLEKKTPIPNRQNLIFYNEDLLEACISSGSFKTDALIMLPCSMNTLAKCAYGISDNLLTRTFSVHLKEKRKIIIAPREMPFNAIQLENMTKLSTLGVIIAPPIIGYYSNIHTIEDMEKFIIGKYYDLLGIEHNLYKRWSDEKCNL
jgi:4-hydroxy-3-polyprenylbenzoate decarboxylase